MLLLILLMSLLTTPSIDDGQYGHVAFANSGSPAAQKNFLEGLALLHECNSDAAILRRPGRSSIVGAVDATC